MASLPDEARTQCNRKPSFKEILAIGLRRVYSRFQASDPPMGRSVQYLHDATEGLGECAKVKSLRMLSRYGQEHHEGDGWRGTI